MILVQWNLTNLIMTEEKNDNPKIFDSGFKQVFDSPFIASSLPAKILYLI